VKPAGSFELHLRHRRDKLCLCGHDGGTHNVLSCKVCDCEYFWQSAYQPPNIPTTSGRLKEQHHDERTRTTESKRPVGPCLWINLTIRHSHD
jgi:hypothetical protein